MGIVGKSRQTRGSHSVVKCLAYSNYLINGSVARVIGGLMHSDRTLSLLPVYWGSSPGTGLSVQYLYSLPYSREEVVPFYRWGNWGLAKFKTYWKMPRKNVIIPLKRNPMLKTRMYLLRLDFTGVLNTSPPPHSVQIFDVFFFLKPSIGLLDSRPVLPGYLFIYLLIYGILV